MGKNEIIKSLSKVIANISLHKLIVIHTKKPESIHFLESEIVEYRNVAQTKAQEFNWNDYEKEKIQTLSLKILLKLKKKKYTDIEFSIKEAEKIILETIEDLIG